MFAYVDSFVNEKIAAVNAVIAALAPGVRTFLDECGTDMDGVLSPGGPPGDNPLYWVASGSSFIYLYARAAALGASGGIMSVGMSQLMDAPGQEPSVTMLDWNSGNGTARYWSLWLLRRSLGPGDNLVATSATNATASASVFAQAYWRSSSTDAPMVLLVNKANAVTNVTVAVTGLGSTVTACTASTVDASTNLGPPVALPCGVGGTVAAPSISVVLQPYANAAVTLQVA